MSAKHFFNDPNKLVISALKSASLTNPSLGLDEQNKVIYVRPSDAEPQVNLLSGGGCGHEPSFTGLVGPGLLSCAVSGTIFASPSAEQITTGIVGRCDTKKGVLAIIMNYTGDVLNFGMGVEKAKQKGVNADMVVVGDDVGVGREKAGKVGRRGIAGTVLVVKIAGALAAQGYKLEDVAKVAKLVAENLVSIGASLDHVHVPGREAKTKDESIGEQEVELGMGIHNEPGSERLSVALPELVGSMLKQLLDQNDKDRAFLKVNSNEVVLLINNLGGVSPLEMAGITYEVSEQLSKTYNIKPCRTLCGTFMTSLNGLGFSITLLNAVNTNLGGPSMVELLDAPSDAVGWPHAISKKNWEEKNQRVRDQPTITTQQAKPTGLKMDGKLCKQMLQGGLERLIKAEPLVTKYDTVVGDGDCGIGLARGAEAILKLINNEEPTGEVAVDVSRITSVIEATMDGTSGALYAIFFNSLVRVLSEVPAGDITPKIWAQCLQKALAALEKYTPAKPGDRTLVDALEPFVESLAKTGSVEKAAAASRTGAESTKGMKASLGRTVYVGGSGFKEVPDPGAYGLSEFFLGLAGKPTSEKAVKEAEKDFEVVNKE